MALIIMRRRKHHQLPHQLSLLLLQHHHTPPPPLPHRLISSIHSLSSHHHQNNTNKPHSVSSLYQYHHHYNSFRYLNHSYNYYRSFSTNRDEKPISHNDDSTSTSSPESEMDGFFHDYNDNFDYHDIASDVAALPVSGDDVMLPIQCLVWFLDKVHYFTALPWWAVIVVSTLALRVAILPVLLAQLQNLKKTAMLAPQLPPPIPPPFSGKSWIEQYKRFREKRIEIGCPSFLWMLAYPSIQIPFLFLGTLSVRQMALNHHAGFETGGTLWFQNLTEMSHGASGFIFPLLLASLHLINVRVSFEKSSLAKLPNVIGKLAKYYRIYLHCLTIPMFFVGFYLPQGSLLYWAANSSLTLVQQLAMKHPLVREKLGLPDKLVPADTEKTHEMDGLEATFIVPAGKKAIHELSQLELYNLSITHLSKGRNDKAVPLLRLILERDPEYVRALLVMGQILMKDGKLAEAIEYFERAISKLLVAGYPKDIEEIDYLILSSTWSCVALAKQGKVAEGIVHLEKIANMKAPEDSKIKTHYCDALFMLSSSLASLGRDVEAAKYLRILTTYDPAYGQYLKDIEGEDSNFANDLENSRRKDY
uniref:ALBINO3-like protein 2, chloroplastic isoform X2 n=1 Tax=Erigeron canadensis TaxID=72917 RepID=UPI001CB931AF|nr:ALBINO3-like protein 2, chloroplastic isoform X2 [Erigeron canadensis]